jgi:S-methylmethionine-dependent homocysteine/selenocysteine methylase
MTDGGIETTLIFQHGLDLPHRAAFDLLRDGLGRTALVRYYERHVAVAKAWHTGFVLESPTSRASADWGARLGYSCKELAAANRDAIGLMCALRDRHEATDSPIVVSGCVGPRADVSGADRLMSAEEAAWYHCDQVTALAEAGADQVTAVAMTSASEAIGVAVAAGASDVPVAIAFTVEADGRLASGQSLRQAIEEVDAATGGLPIYYMVNCAGPQVFAHVPTGQSWMKRLHGIRVDVSKRRPVEPEVAADLDGGNAVTLAAHYAALRRRFPWINVLGGCSGTDHRHIELVSESCVEWSDA